MICRILGACILIVYLGTLYGTYVPDWHFRVQNTDSPDFGKVLTVRPLLFSGNISNIS